MEMLEATTIHECEICGQLYFPGDEVVEVHHRGEDLAHSACYFGQNSAHRKGLAISSTSE